MSIIDFINNQSTSFIKSLSANVSLFTMDNDDIKQQKELFNNMTELCLLLHQNVIEKKIDLTSEPYRLYTSMKSDMGRSYYCFQPQLHFGYTPFIIDEGEEDISGFMFKMKHVSFKYCPKTINQLTQTLINDALNKTYYLSSKKAREKVWENIRNGNIDNVPLIKCESIIDVYYHKDEQMFSCKNTHKSLSALTSFPFLLKHVKNSEKINKLLTKATKKLIKETFEHTFCIVPYTNHAITSGISYGAYNIPNIIDFYADNPSDALQFTNSVSFYAQDKVGEQIKFINSMKQLIDDSSKNEETVSFKVLQEFSCENNLHAFELTLSGEILKTPQIISYYKEVEIDEENDIYNQSQGDYLDFVFTTKSVDGNISFKIKSGLKIVISIFKKELSTFLNCNTLSPQELEKAIITHQAKLLPLLGDINNIFKWFYIDANKQPKQFGDKTVLTEVIG